MLLSSKEKANWKYLFDFTCVEFFMALWEIKKCVEVKGWKTWVPQGRGAKMHETKCKKL